MSALLSSNPSSTPPTTERSLQVYNKLPAASVAIQPVTPNVYIHDHIYIKGPFSLSTTTIRINTQLSKTSKEPTKRNIPPTSKRPS